jgi:hypothetical protein
MKYNTQGRDNTTDLETVHYPVVVDEGWWGMGASVYSTPMGREIDLQWASRQHKIVDLIRNRPEIA